MKRPLITYLVIFLAAAAVFSIPFFRIPALRDYDGYFHAKMGEIVMEKGFIKEFPWTQFTFQKDRFTNPYFLFHTYLGLWIKLLPASPLVAVKLAMLVLLGLIAAAFYKVIKAFSARWTWLGLALLPAMLSYPAYERLTQVRPHVVSILILILGVGAILGRKWWILGGLSVLYAYSYSAPHLLPVVAFLASVVFSLKERRFAWEPVASSLGGMVAGLIVNPYFPRNLHFLYAVTIKMAARTSSVTSITPGELRAIDSWQALYVNLASFVALFLCVLAVFITGKKLSARSLFLFVTAGFFFVLLLRAVRFVEYWPFFAALCACSILGETVAESPRFAKVMKRPVAVLCAVVLLTVGALQVKVAATQAVTFVPFASLKEVMEVLDKEAEAGDIVYSKDWDMAQPMFYLSDKVYYLVMFDPEMMRLAHPGLYDLWYFINHGRLRSGDLPLIRSIEAQTKDAEIQKLRTALESGQVMDRLPDIIKSAFGAKWIIWNHRSPNEQYEFRSLMSSFPDTIIFVTGNEDFSLYRLR